MDTRGLFDALRNDPTSESALGAFRHALTVDGVRQQTRHFLDGMLSQQCLSQRERHAALLVADALGAEDASYRASAVEIDITPDLDPSKPTHLAGFDDASRRACDVLNPLAMQLLLVEDGALNRLLFVTADLFGFSDETVAAVRAAAWRFGVTPEAVVLNASHTHYAPVTVHRLSQPTDGYDESFTAEIATAIERALEYLDAALEPCLLYAGACAVNLGRRSQEGTMGDLASGSDAANRAATPLLEIDFIRSGNSLIFVNHGFSPKGLGPAAVIGAGYPGYFRTYLLQHGVADMVMFAQGACGAPMPAPVDGTAPTDFNLDGVILDASMLAEAVVACVQGPLRPVRGGAYAHLTRLLVAAPSEYAGALRPSELALQLVALDSATCFMSVGAVTSPAVAAQLLLGAGLPATSFFLGCTNGLAGTLSETDGAPAIADDEASAPEPANTDQPPSLMDVARRLGEALRAADLGQRQPEDQAAMTTSDATVATEAWPHGDGSAVEAPIAVQAQRAAVTPRRILFLEQAGVSTGDFLDHIVGRYGRSARYLKTADLTEAQAAIEQADLIWLEWAGPLTAAVTQRVDALREKPVICRLHGFEVFTDMPSKVAWDSVDHLVFVANHKLDLFNERLPNVRVKRSIIRNGINTSRFTVAENKQNTRNLVLLGNLNHRKGLPMLLQFFHELLKHDPSFHLFIRGEWQDARYQLAVNTMIRELGIASSITFVDEWVHDLDAWLADKSHVLSFSLEESFHYAVGNGMAAGLKPVVHAWTESRAIWPEEFIFRNLDEFLALMLEDRFEPMRYRALLDANGLTAQRQLREVDAVVREVWSAYASSGDGARTAEPEPPEVSPATASGDSDGSVQVAPQVRVAPRAADSPRAGLEAKYTVDRTNGLVLKQGERLQDYMALLPHLKAAESPIPQPLLIDYLQFTFQKLIGPYFNARQLPQPYLDTLVAVLERMHRDHGVAVDISVETSEHFVHGVYHLLKEHLSPAGTETTIRIAPDSALAALPEATDDVRNLYRALKTAFEPLHTHGLLSLFVVHGSLATLDFTRFSDADTQLFLTEDAFASPEMILEVAKLISHNNLYLKDFDPLQHHGYFVATDLDRTAYPEPFLPLETMRRARRLFGEEEQTFATRPLPFADQFAAWHMGHFFRHSYLSHRWPRQPFDVKRYLSRFSMLPVLHLELLENEYPYKGDVFTNWQRHFPPHVWHPFQTVSSVRATWNPARTVHFPETFHRQVFDFAEMLLDRLNEQVSKRTIAYQAA